jgi:hypothetical protein
VEILQYAPNGQSSSDGLDVYVFVLSVSANGNAPYAVKVRSPVPPEAFRLLSPGRNLPARCSPDQPDEIVIDWGAALAEDHR